MNRQSKKRDVFTILIILVLGTFFIGSAGVVFGKADTQNEKLVQVDQELGALTENKSNLEKTIQELKQRLQDVESEVQVLKKELDQVKTQNQAIVMPKLEKEGKYAYLTFDDGPSHNTIKILDFLSANDIKATFFVLGKPNQTEVYKRIVDEGHTLAVHSNTHEYSDIYRSVDSFMEDINSLSQLLESATGVKPEIMRFPGGSNNIVSKRYGGAGIMDAIIPTVKKAGFAYFDWNVDSADAQKSKQDKQVIIDSVLSGAKNKTNAVILMHDAAAKTTTVEALPEIVKGLREQGFTFKPLTAQSEPVQFK